MRERPVGALGSPQAMTRASQATGPGDPRSDNVTADQLAGGAGRRTPGDPDQRVIRRVEVRTEAASTSGPLTPLVAELMMSRNFTTSTESEFDT